MINFDIKNTAVFQTLSFKENFKLGLINGLQKLLFWLFLIFSAAFLYGFLNTESVFSSIKSLSLLFGLLLISLTSSLFFWSFKQFFEQKLKNPRFEYSLKEALSSPQDFNFASFLDLDSMEAFWQAIRFSRSRKLDFISTQAVLYFLLNKKSLKIDFIFNRALLDFEELKDSLGNFLKQIKGIKFSNKLSPECEKVVLEAAKLSAENNKEKIGSGELLSALSETDPFLKKFLVQSEIKKEDIANINWWVGGLLDRMEVSKKFWIYENLVKKGSIARGWSAGYTVNLDQFSTDWTEIIKNRGYGEIIGHKKELDQTERILSRENINNVLLIGDQGTGRRGIIHEIARKSLLNLSTPQVNSKRVVFLDIVSILTKTGSKKAAESTLDLVFKEAATAGNVILVIDDFHNYIGQAERPGIVDISGVINPYLSLPNFQIIAMTNFSGFHKFIEPNTAILNLFEKVEVGPNTERETIQILENATLGLEQKYKMFTSYQAIRDIVTLSGRYIPSIPFPKKALDLLDEIIVYVARYTRSKVVLPEHVARIISDKTQIPVGEVEMEEKEVLLNLENLIHQRIINQEEAVSEVSSALRRARADITTRKGPMGGFLFLGPTGVGKTETSKALAEVYFGSEDKMIRLDMSEFQSVGDISRLLGSTEEEGLLTTPVRENPFSLILLDEIEKAHPNVLNLFLQVLDEGILTDGLGRKVDFKNTIIIATSNAGYQVILDAIKEQKQMSEIKQKLLDFLFANAIYRPEFVNRFDAVVIFRSLTKEHLLKIAELLFQKLRKNLLQKDIELEITLPLKEKIVELGYDPVFGARNMKRVLQDKVENVVAMALLSNQIKPGNKITINSENFEIKTIL